MLLISQMCLPKSLAIIKKRSWMRPKCIAAFIDKNHQQQQHQLNSSNLSAFSVRAVFDGSFILRVFFSFHRAALLYRKNCISIKWIRVTFDIWYILDNYNKIKIQLIWCCCLPACSYRQVMSRPDPIQSNRIQFSLSIAPWILLALTPHRCNQYLHILAVINIFKQHLIPLSHKNSDRIKRRKNTQTVGW